MITLHEFDQNIRPYLERRALPLCPESGGRPSRCDPSRCAITGLMHRSKTASFDHLVGGSRAPSGHAGQSTRV
jgi:hypothetical protein